MWVRWMQTIISAAFANSVISSHINQVGLQGRVCLGGEGECMNCSLDAEGGCGLDGRVMCITPTRWVIEGVRRWNKWCAVSTGRGRIQAR
jgi:hypothetical protein